MFMLVLIFFAILAIVLLIFSVNLLQTQSVNTVERFGKFIHFQKVSLRIQQLDMVAETKIKDNTFYMPTNARDQSETVCI
jgi:regulator of protease activity HflC (stomatin/prohibitin superfamily)